MLEALVAGTHDPDILAELARGKLRAKLPALREALEANFRSEHHGILVAQILAHIDYLDETIATLSERIGQVIAPFSKERELLMTIPGVARVSAEVLIAEIGVDMRCFRPPHTSPPGRVSVPAITSRRANANLASRATAPNGWQRR